MTDGDKLKIMNTRCFKQMDQDAAEGWLRGVVIFTFAFNIAIKTDSYNFRAASSRSPSNSSLRVSSLSVIFS